MEIAQWERSLSEGLVSLIENNQVNAISFEGGPLLTQEIRQNILKRAENIELSWKPFNRLKTNIKFLYDNVRFDVKRLMTKLPKRKRTQSSPQGEDIIARAREEFETLLTAIPMQDITPVSTAASLRRMAEQVTVKLSITERRVDLSTVDFDNHAETGTAWSAFFKVDHSNQEGLTLYEEGGRQKSTLASVENKGNAAILTLPIPESLLNSASAEVFLRALAAQLPDLLGRDGASLVVSTRAYRVEIEREAGILKVEKHKMGGDNKPVEENAKLDLINDFLKLLKAG